MTGSLSLRQKLAVHKGDRTCTIHIEDERSMQYSVASSSGSGFVRRYSVLLRTMCGITNTSMFFVIQ